MAVSERVSDQAFVTLATTDAYAFGAMVLGRSLRRVGTSRQLAIMVGPGLSQEIRVQLSRVFDEVVAVDVLDSRDSMNLDLLTRPDLGVTFTKLHCWRLTQYTKAVFLDADTLVVQNIDELFNREELSASPDAGWPDCFNSGVFVYRPSLETYTALIAFAIEHGSFDGGDQGLLNLYFNDWATKDISKHLPFVYNCVSQAFYSYLPAFKQFGKDVKLVHFIGALKPWHHTYNTETRQVEKTGDIGHHTAFLQLWWDIFMADIRSELNPKLLATITHHSTSTCVKRLMHGQEESLPSSPSSPPKPPPPTPDTSYVTSRYIPPNVKVFYEVLNLPLPTHMENTEMQQSMHKDDHREYTHYESFYVEPPMKTVFDYGENVDHVYDVNKFETKWTEFKKTTAESESKSECEADSLDESDVKDIEDELNDIDEFEQAGDSNKDEHVSTDASVISDSDVDGEFCDTTALTNYDDTDSCGVDTVRTNSSESSADSGLVFSATNKNVKHGGVDAMTLRDDNYNDVSKVEHELCDIAGHMAHLSLHPSSHRGSGSYTPEQLADTGRQYSWEKGQIDYLGIDAFSNIQKRLDEVLATKPSSPDPVQPPVLQPPTQKTAQGGAKPKQQPKTKKPGILKKR